jgi:hypothetical protein
MSRRRHMLNHLNFMCFISFLSLFKLIISYNMDSDKAGCVFRGMAGGDDLEKERHINFKGSAIEIVGRCMAQVNFKGNAIETVGRCMAQVNFKGSAIETI